MIIGAARRRIAALLAPYDRLVLWGAGGSGVECMRLLPGKVTVVIDSFKAGQEFQGLIVQSPDCLLEDQPVGTALVIGSTAVNEIESWLRAHRVELPAWSYQDLLAEGVGAGRGGRLLADLLAYYRGGWFRTLVKYPQISLVVSYRLCARVLHSRNPLMKLLRPWLLWRHSRKCVFYGIELPPEVSAGPGLMFPHCGTIVIHRNARIGANCTIYQGVTVGADKRGGTAVLGDQVTLWAGSSVIGECRFERRSQLGAGSICIGPLTVPAGRTAVGVPARVLADAQPGASV